MRRALLLVRDDRSHIDAARKRQLTAGLARYGWDVTPVALGSDACRLLKSRAFDAIISSSSESVHAVAARVHGDIPWVADLRESAPASAGRFGRKLIERVFASRTFRSVSAITTSSMLFMRELQRRYPSVPVYTVPNAFLGADWDGVAFLHPRKATLLFTGGGVYDANGARPLFAAVADLLRGGLVTQDELRVTFVTDVAGWIDRAARLEGVRSVVRLHPLQTHARMRVLQRSATRLLLFPCGQGNGAGLGRDGLGEYLGARRLILAIGEPLGPAVDELFQRGTVGDRARSVKAIRDSVLRAVQEWRAGTTPIVEAEVVRPYESTQAAGQFAEILDFALRA